MCTLVPGTTPALSGSSDALTPCCGTRKIIATRKKSAQGAKREFEDAFKEARKKKLETANSYRQKIDAGETPNYPAGCFGFCMTPWTEDETDQPEKVEETKVSRKMSVSESELIDSVRDMLSAKVEHNPIYRDGNPQTADADQTIQEKRTNSVTKVTPV